MTADERFVDDPAKVLKKVTNRSSFHAGLSAPER